MDDEELILASEFCTCHDVDLSLIISLSRSGLVDLVVVREETFVPRSQLRQLEQLLRLNQEMDINLAGIETISYLLQRMEDMKKQIIALNNKLAFYQGH